VAQHVASAACEGPRGKGHFHRLEAESAAHGPIIPT
jgi:hypothetical protein